MSDSREQLDMLSELAKNANVFDKNLSAATKNLNSFGKAINEAKEAQRDFVNELKSSAKAKQSPLTSGQMGADDVSIALYDFAMKMKSQGKDDQMDDTLKKSLDILAKKIEPGDYATKSDEKRQEELRKAITGAISDGYDVIGAGFSDNPYLRRISEMGRQLDEKRKKDSQSSVGNALQGIGKWGGNNPITKMIGGIGGMISTGKKVTSTLGQGSDFLFGGGMQARYADINTEKDRRSNVRSANLINARQNRAGDINDILKNNEVSPDKRSKYEGELASIKAMNADTMATIRKTSERMSANMSTSSEYKMRKLNPSVFDGYSDTDQKYLRNAYGKNALKSLSGSMDKSSPSGGNKLSKLDGLQFVSKSSMMPTISYTEGDVAGMRAANGMLHARNVLNSPNIYSLTERNKAISSTMGSIGSKTFGDVLRGPSTSKTFGDVLKGGMGAASKVGGIFSAITPKSKPRTLPEYVAGIYKGVMDQNLLLAKTLGFGDKKSGSLPLSAYAAIAGLAAGALGPSILHSMGIGDGTVHGSGASGMRVSSQLGTFGAKKAAGSIATTSIPEMAQMGLGAGGKTLLKEAPKLGAKAGLKMIPVVGTAMAAGFAANRAMQGDYSGAMLEMVSGIAPLLGPEGMLGSIAADVLLVRHDMQMAAQEAKIDKNEVKIRSMASEMRPLSTQERGELQARLNALAAHDVAKGTEGMKLAVRVANLHGQANAKELMK